VGVAGEAVQHDEGRAWRLRAAATPYLLLVPGLLALATVSLYPIFYGIRASVHRYRYGIDMGSAGTQNYVNVYHDPVFWEAVKTTAKFVVIAVSIETVLGLALALLVSRELRFSGLIRVTLILPMTIAPVVVGVIWRLLYASDIGIVNPLFQWLGFGAPNVLAHGGTAFLGLVAVDAWEWTPLLFLILLAGLHSLPQDPLEAAQVDAVGTFDQIFVLTKGGPGTSTQLISIYSYNTAFLFTQYGQAMAMLIALLLCLLLLMVAAVHFLRRTSEAVA
jgi:ABC-type sugar transport system permease subunit